MSETILEISKIGWRFDNSYARLPKMMLSRLAPVPVQMPKLIILNHSLSEELGLDFSVLADEHVASMFAGNLLPQGSEPIAQAYAGHQFGHFTMLGDGRAIVIGEHLTPDNKRVDIQFKGSGRTPYARGGDGRLWRSAATRAAQRRDGRCGVGQREAGCPPWQAHAGAWAGAGVRKRPPGGSRDSLVTASCLRRDRAARGGPIGPRWFAAKLRNIHAKSVGMRVAVLLGRCRSGTATKGHKP